MKFFFTFLFLLTLVFVKASLAQTPNWQWAEAETSGSCNMDVKGLFVGPSGNIYAGGWFGGNLILNGASANAAGTEVFSAKLDTGGVFSWIAPHPYSGGNDYDYGFGGDKYENTYVTGQTQGSNGLFIDKYNKARVKVWSFAPAALSSGMGGYGNIGIDNSGNVYATGSYGGTKNFGPNTITSLGTGDMFLTKLDSNGNCKWAVSAGGAGQTIGGRGVAVDPQGDVYVCGSYKGSVSFGSITPPVVSTDAFFIAKYDSLGNVIWVQTATNAGFLNDSYYFWMYEAITVDSASNVYVTGHFQNISQFGPLSITSNGGYDVFVAKCLSDGKWEWAKDAGGGGDDYGWGITLDKRSDVYVTGMVSNSGNVYFDSQIINPSASTVTFVAKYANSDGDVQWVQTSAGTLATNGQGIGIDNNTGDVYIDGTMGAGSGATFGASSISGVSGCSIFFAKLDTVAARAIVPVVNTNYCPGSTYKLPYSLIGSFNGGNTFTAQLSNDSGSFAFPVDIGSIISNSNDSIEITIPSNAIPGSTYLIRVVSSSPATSSYANGNGVYYKGGVYTNNFYVTIGGAITVKVSNDTTICSGSFVQLHASGGTTYSWSPAATLNDSTSANPYAAPTSPQIYTVIVSNGACGSDTAKVTVNVNPAANVSVSPSNTTACSGVPVSLTATGATSYTWTPATGLNCYTCANPIATTTVNTTYSVTGNNGACSNTFLDTITVANTSVGGIVTAVRDTICEGTAGNLTLAGNSSGTIQWQSSPDGINFTNVGDTLSKCKTTPLTQTTSYRATVGSGSCSATSDTLTLYVPPALVASFYITQTGTNQFTFNSDSSTGNIRSYHWDFGDGGTSSDSNPLYTYAKDSTYYVCLTLYDGSNCSYTYCRYNELEGVPTISAGGNWVVYPNPFNEQLIISSKQTNSHIQSVEMYDVLGQMVVNKIPGNTTNTSLQLDVSSLAKGMYYVMIRTADADYVQKVVKQ